MKIRTLTTTDDVIDALGSGPAGFGKRYGYSKQNVDYYRRIGTLPARIFLLCQRDLKKIHCRAPAKLWGIEEPASRAA